MRKLFFEAMAYVDDRYAYGSRVDKNMLCKVDMLTGECEYVSIFPMEDKNGERLHMKALKYKNKIIFSPSAANNVCIYDYINNKFKMINVHQYEKNGANRKMKYSEIVLNDEFAYVFPATYGDIIKINMETLMVENSISISENVPYIFRKDGLVRSEKLFLTSANSNVILEFDMKAENVKLHRIGQNNNGSWSICDDGENLWIIPYIFGSIVKWNPQTDTVSERFDCNEYFVKEKYMFMKAVVRENKIYAIPLYSELMMILDMETGNIDWININENTDIVTNIYLGYIDNTVIFLGSKVKGRWIKEKDNSCFGWNLITNEINEYNLCLKNDGGEYMKDYFCLPVESMWEDESTLIDYISYLKKHNN